MSSGSITDSFIEDSLNDKVKKIRSILNEKEDIMAEMDTGKIETVKGGLLSKEQKKFICQNGHKSSPEAEFCENYNCSLNIKGLTRENVIAWGIDLGTQKACKWDNTYFEIELEKAQNNPYYFKQNKSHPSLKIRV